jgi:hypothetical protein
MKSRRPDLDVQHWAMVEWHLLEMVVYNGTKTST